MTVSIVDYGLGNLGSVLNMFKRIGADATIVSTPSEVLESERVLLPGIGAFDHGMAKVKDAGLFGPLREFAATGRPFFGICLGMQLLMDSSEEGEAAGLGLIPGQSRRIPATPTLRVPHMGWNSIRARRPDPLIAGAEAGSRFYFVHSYHVVPEQESDALTTTTYGEEFVSMVRLGNVMGAQFHPEKSHSFGMTILANFAQV